MDRWFDHLDRLRKEWQRYQDLIKPYNKFLEHNFTTFHLKKIIEEHDWLKKQSTRIIEEMQQQRNIISHFEDSTFKRLLGEISHYDNIKNQLLRNFDLSISGLGYQIFNQVIHRYDLQETETVVEEISKPSLNDIIEQVLSNILNKIDELVKSGQTAPLIQKGWVQLFLNTVITILITLYLGSKDERFINEKFAEQELLIEKSKKEIIDRIDFISPKKEWRPYLVQRPTIVKLKKNFKSLTIARLSEGNQVNVVRIEKKWAYIEFFDYQNGVPSHGWVPKKYLKSI